MLYKSGLDPVNVYVCAHTRKKRKRKKEKKKKRKKKTVVKKKVDE